MRALLDLIEPLELGVDVAPQLAHGQTLRAIADEAEGAVLRRHELREVALLGLEPARRREVPAVLLPRRAGDLQRVLVRVGHDHVHDEADLRLLALDGQRALALVLLPRGAIARHRHREAVDGAHDDRVHALHRRRHRVAHVPERRVGLLERAQVHRQLLEGVEVAGVRQLLVAEPLADDGQRLQVARVVRLRVGFLAPEERLHHAATADADFEPAAAQVIEHADLLDQPQRMVQRQHVHARAEAHACRALRHGAEEHVLRGRQAVDGRRVVLGEVIGVEPGAVERFDLQQALAVDLIQPQAGHRLDVIEDAEREAHTTPSVLSCARSSAPRPSHSL